MRMRFHSLPFRLRQARAWPTLAVMGLVALLGCGAEPGGEVSEGETRAVFVATIAPVAAIARELTAGRADVRVLVTPGDSPHAYEPRPSDAVAAARAAAVIHVSGELDGWAARLDSRRGITLLDLVPPELVLPAMAEETGEVDPHFWFDPLAVKGLIGPLAEALGEADPEGAEAYADAARRFGGELELLHEEIAARLTPFRGRRVYLFHPSFRYLLARYGLELGGAVELNPGAEATSKHLMNLADGLKEAGVLFTEPQLPDRAARAVAEAAGARVVELDPLGGVPGRETYAELIRHNVNLIAEAVR